jgi:hypothetical protein
MAYGSINADSIVTSVSGGILGAGNASIMKNRLINGAMVIDQRNAGASVTPTTTGTYILDRWQGRLTQASKYSVQQNAGSVTPPVGFTNYLGVTSLSAFSVATGDTFGIQQLIEGFNTADLGWGTANAKTVTLSFWVRSSLTGTFGGAIRNDAGDRSYPFSYTISSANTWEYETITIAGDTTGTWATTTSTGVAVQFGLGAGATFSGTAGAWAATSYTNATGATSVVGTNGATFYITGVQLEVGSSATGYEYVNYQTSLANCQRYYQKNTISYGAANGTTTLAVCYQFPVYMRVAPTCSLLTSSPYAELAYLTGFTASSATLNVHNFTGGTDFQVTGFTGMTQYRAPMFLDANQIGLSAEL